MAKHFIEIDGNAWTRGKAERRIASFLWAQASSPIGAIQPLSNEAQNFIRQFIVGGPQSSTFLPAIQICVRLICVGRKVPTLVFRFEDGSSRSISYRSLRDSEETVTKKKELRGLRWLTRQDRSEKRRAALQHVDDVAPGTFQWRARLFKRRWLEEHEGFDVYHDKGLQDAWRAFYILFPLESVTPEENYLRKLSSDQKERLYKAVEAAAPPHIRSMTIDRAALWVTWRNQGGWDVPSLGYFEDHWLDFPLRIQADVRTWIGSFA